LEEGKAGSSSLINCNHSTLGWALKVNKIEKKKGNWELGLFSLHYNENKASSFDSMTLL
jgi:hypothetical protein